MTSEHRGIQDGYHDMSGTWRPTSDETRQACLAAMGNPEKPGHEPKVRVIRAGTSVPIPGPVQIRLEDGTVLALDHGLPPDLPLGYHEILPVDSESAQTLIIAPPRCYLPDLSRVWGWAVQLYATRSRLSWGFGDLADLRRLAHWSREQLGAGMTLLNPLHAPLPLASQQPSPYFPSSRRYRNPLYLRVEEVPGAGETQLDLERLASTGRALNEDRRIDRDAVYRLKMTALDLLWQRFPGDPAFDSFREEGGRSLEEFATFCVLAEEYQSGWSAWPEEYRRPDSPAVARFAAEHAGRVAFHAWLQWGLDRQLALAGKETALVQDLAIGVDPDGADAWAWQGVLARGVTVGAPPDDFNTQGQDWGLPPFIPDRLRAMAYRPFVETMRASLRHAGGLRIDHVMGLFRLFWIPNGLGPGQGVYVRYPAEDLLAIVALESHRAKAFVVGEDLGTVEDAAREQLAAHAMLSYRLLWFEPRPPAEYPRLALSAVTTHDLPTIAGLWNGSDLLAQREIGLQPNEEGTRMLRERIGAAAGVPANAPVDEVIVRTYERLAEAPSLVLTATLDDALAVSERPNMPGTITEWPNWSIALPVPLEDVERANLPRRVAGALGGERVL